MRLTLFERFRDKLLYVEYGNMNTGALDPRYPEVRAYRRPQNRSSCKTAFEYPVLGAADLRAFKREYGLLVENAADAAITVDVFENFEETAVTAVEIPSYGILRVPVCQTGMLRIRKK